MKKLFILLVLMMAGIAAYFMFGNPLGQAVKLALEEIGPKMTQADVRVSSVKMSATDGHGEIVGLLLGNPNGFKTDYALQAGKIEIAVEPASLVQDVVLIRNVVINEPKIIYESGDHGSNFDAIQRNIKQYLNVDAKQRDDKAAKKMIIESLIIRNAHVSYNDTLSLDLPDIELHDIGKKSGGATSAQVVKAIIGELTTQILLAIPKAVAGGITSAFKGLFQ